MANVISKYSVELNQDDVKELLSMAVQNETQRKVTSIEFHINGGSEDRFQYTPPLLGKVVVQLGEPITGFVKRKS